MSVKVIGMIRTASAVFLSFLLLVFAGLPSPALAWGALGHRLVARLAEPDLQPQARSQIEWLLQGEADPSLAGIATWADNLRDTDPDLGKATSRWHYVNIGEQHCAYARELACPDGDCVVEALREQTAILADRTRSRAERLQALKFVVHFAGDIHQPLHAGYAHDRGGNDFQTNYEGKGSNLHSVWDSGLLKSRGLDEDAYVQHLRALPTAHRDAFVLPPPAARWAEQSCTLALRPGFYPRRAKLDSGYYTQHLPLAEQQLRLGGARLAQLLNQALAAP